MKVLVACSAKRDMLYPESERSILALNWPDGAQVDTLFLVGGDKDQRWLNLCRKMNEARSMALLGGYEALVTVDSDIIVPPYALRRMASAEADVVYGLLILRFGSYEWNLTNRIEPQGIIELVSSNKEAARACWGKVVECKGHGQACCFIRRSVLEKVAFRDPKPSMYAPDWFFSFDCQDLGFRQVMDLGVVCGHIDPPWILWPDPDEPDLCRREPYEGTV